MFRSKGGAKRTKTNKQRKMRHDCFMHASFDRHIVIEFCGSKTNDILAFIPVKAENIHEFLCSV